MTTNPVEPQSIWRRIANRSPVPKWSALRQIGNSRLAKSTIILPVIGYAIIFNDEVMQRVHIYAPLTSEHAWWMLSSKRKLFLLYLGGSIFAFATVIFQWRCPDLVKKFASEHAFYSEELRIITRRRIEDLKSELRKYIKIENSIHRSGIETLIRERAANPLGSSDELLINEGFTHENRDSIRDVVVSSYMALDTSRAVARSTIALLYAIAIILTTIPTLEFTLRVVIEAFKSDS